MCLAGEARQSTGQQRPAWGWPCCCWALAQLYVISLPGYATLSCACTSKSSSHNNCNDRWCLPVCGTAGLQQVLHRKGCPMHRAKGSFCGRIRSLWHHKSHIFSLAGAPKCDVCPWDQALRAAKNKIPGSLFSRSVGIQPIFLRQKWRRIG